MNWIPVLNALLLANIVGFVIAMRIAGKHRAELAEARRSRDYFAARAEALTKDLLSMRRDGFSVQKPATIHEPPDGEAEALAAAEGALLNRMRGDDKHFITEATRRIMAETGVSEPVARAEAWKLRRGVTDEDPPG